MPKVFNNDQTVLLTPSEFTEKAWKTSHKLETIEQTLRLEIAGYLVEYEFRVSNSLDAAYEDVVAIDLVAAQPVELIQLMRPTLRAGN